MYKKAVISELSNPQEDSRTLSLAYLPSSAPVFPCGVIFYHILRFKPQEYAYFGSFLNTGNKKCVLVGMTLREYYREPYPFKCEWPFDLWFTLEVSQTLMLFSDNTSVLFLYYAFINLWNNFSKDEWLCSFTWGINRRFSNHGNIINPHYQLSNVFTKIVRSWVIWVPFIFKGHHFRQFQMSFHGH